MPTSEEDLQAQRERNDELRAEITAEEMKRVEIQGSLQNDINAAELDAEEARLEAQLAAIRADNERLESITPQPLVAAQAAMEQAVAAQKAQEEAVAAKAKADEDAEALRVKAEEEAAAQRAAEEVAAQQAAAEAAAAAAENKKGGN
jgi:hypothetical protein